MPPSSIKGTGPEGRIVKADVEDYLGVYFRQCLTERCLDFFKLHVILVLCTCNSFSSKMIRKHVKGLTVE